MIELKLYGVVYLFLNTKTNEYYIGGTKDSNNRYRTHLNQLKQGKHRCRQLQEAWTRQNGEGFEIQVVEKAFSLEQLEEAERKWLDRLYDTKACYNISSKNVGHRSGDKKTLEHKQKIAVGVAHYWSDKDHPSKGIPRTPEVKQKISKSNQGTVFSLERRDKIRQAHIGRIWTEEEKKKLRKPKGRTVEHANKFKKSVLELSTGKFFQSLKEVKEFYAISPAFLNKALQKNAPLIKGKLKGLHFVYAQA